MITGITVERGPTLRENSLDLNKEETNDQTAMDTATAEEVEIEVDDTPPSPLPQSQKPETAERRAENGKEGATSQASENDFLSAPSGGQISKFVAATERPSAPTTDGTQSTTTAGPPALAAGVASGSNLAKTVDAYHSDSAVRTFSATNNVPNTPNAPVQPFYYYYPQQPQQLQQQPQAVVPAAAAADLVAAYKRRLSLSEESNQYNYNKNPRLVHASRPNLTENDIPLATNFGHWPFYSCPILTCNLKANDRFSVLHHYQQTHLNPSQESLWYNPLVPCAQCPMRFYLSDKSTHYQTYHPTIFYTYPQFFPDANVK